MIRFRSRGWALLARTVYYLAILAAISILASRQMFSTPGFVYQGF